MANCVDYDAEYDDAEKYKIKITTVHGTVFKLLFQQLALQADEIKLLFSHDRIKINYYENASSSIDVNIDNSNYAFKEFVCKKDIEIGINIKNVSHALRTIGVKDELTLYLKTISDKLDDVFGFILSGNIETEYELNMIELNDNNYEKQDDEYQCDIKMKSSDLNDIVSRLKAVGGDCVGISLSGSVLTFTSVGDNGKASISLNTGNYETNQQVNSLTKRPDIINIYINLTKLIDVVKFHTITKTTVKLYLDNNKMFILEYPLLSLGTVKIGLAPILKPDNF